MPDGAVATPAAPAAAAPSAPAASSSPTPTSTPAPAESTPSITPAATPVEGAQPVAAEPAVADPAAAAKPGEPKQEDFPGDVEAFLRARNEWEWGVQPEEKPAEDAAPAPEGDAKPPEEAAKPAEEKPAEAEAPTPEALNALIQSDPAFKAAVEANPQVKGALFSMARKLAQAEPIAQLFGNLEAAQFAEQSAGTMVEVRSGFLSAVENGDVAGAYERFAQEFQEVGPDGKPKVDQQGNPVFGEDFHMLNDYIVDTYHDVEIADLEASLSANQFASDEQREQADMALQALKFIKDFKAGKLADHKPDLSKMDPEAKAYYENKERELAEREEKLNGNKRQQTAAEKQAERSNFEQGVARKVGGTAGKRIQDMIDDQAKAGVFIPSYVLEAKDPQTGIPLFAKTLLDKFEEKTYGRTDSATGKVIGGVSYLRNQARQMAMRPPSPEAEQARVDFALKLFDDYMPDIFRTELRQIQRKAQTDAERRGQKPDANGLIEREPRTTGAPAPKALTAADAMKQAYTEVDQKYPDATPSERLEKALQIKNRIMGTGY